MITNILFYALIGAVGVSILLGSAVIGLKDALSQERTDAAMLANELAKTRRLVVDELPRQYNWNKGEEEHDLSA